MTRLDNIAYDVIFENGEDVEDVNHEKIINLSIYVKDSRDGILVMTDLMGALAAVDKFIDTRRNINENNRIRSSM